MTAALAAARIRAARPGDAAACAAILNAWIDATPWMVRVHPAEAVLRHYRERVLTQQSVFVAEVAGAVAGFLALDLAEAKVTALYVAAAHRGRGIGAALLGRAKAARPDRLRLWAFAANAGARRFYAREGFREAWRTEGENEEGLPDVLFLWGSHPGAPS
ncbi:GNAT family N-acetyltransferase [Paralimibaculum aggregatum]|uniref:GNAT family N-acetyltransferase n=1 Tax=Paralimibaculum aggregatum TaxID=3036245 RepID=A0ABQ6LS14_9RHOB|nr:GNAT family N-acetyltransferase [Limibaculum sp. NKW23]GMG84426.1 GNAT family N-acetyltransferase [Limibaculum sp. NKW23]